MSEKSDRKTSNSIGKGKINLTVHVSEDIRKALGELADRSGAKIGEYCRAILEDAARRAVLVKSETKVTLVSEHGWPATSEVSSKSSDARKKAALGGKLARKIVEGERES